MGFGFGGGGSGGSKAAVKVLVQSATPVSVGATLAETTLATYTLPGGTMGLNGSLRVTAVATTSNGANNKTIKLKLGSLTFASAVATTSASYGVQKSIRNRNSQSSQVGSSSTTNTDVVPTAASVITGAIDTSVNQTVAITGTTTLETGFTPSPTTNISGTGAVVTVIQTAHGLNTGEFIKSSGSTTTEYNVNPVAITKIDANTFTFAGTGTGTPATAPTIQRYSVITLEAYTIELLPGAN